MGRRPGKSSLMKAVLIAGCVGVAAAFVPGLAPMKMAAPVARATNAEMMPQFLKDLFPDMDKPDNPLAGIQSFFAGLTGDDDKPKEDEPSPDEPPAEENSD